LTQENGAIVAEGIFVDNALYTGTLAYFDPPYQCVREELWEDGLFVKEISPGVSDDET